MSDRNSFERRLAFAIACLVVALLAIAASVAWATRWQYVSAERGAVYMINRWTGEARLLLDNRWQIVQPDGPWGTGDRPAQ